jgi:uncharacterized protein YqfB (UPF0267 family)
MNGDTLKQVSLQRSADELMHSELLANTMIQIVGTPVMKLDQLISTLKCCYQQPPSNLTNLKQVVQDILPGEVCVIEFI